MAYSQNCYNKSPKKIIFSILEVKKQNTGWLTDEEEAKKIAKDLDVSIKEVMHMENRLNSNDATFDLSSDDEDDEKAFSPESIY